MRFDDRRKIHEAETVSSLTSYLLSFFRFFLSFLP